MRISDWSADVCSSDLDRTDASGLDRRVDSCVAAHHDNRHIEQTLRPPFFKQAYAVGVGHPDIQQEQIGSSPQARSERLCGIFSQLERMYLDAHGRASGRERGW